MYKISPKICKNVAFLWHFYAGGSGGALKYESDVQVPTGEQK